LTSAGLRSRWGDAADESYSAALARGTGAGIDTFFGCRRFVESVRRGGGEDVSSTRTRTNVLIDGAGGGGLRAALRAMRAIDRLPGYHGELWREMGRTIRAFGTGRTPRCRARHGTFGSGRRSGRRARGAAYGDSNAPRESLEFAHAILLDADRHDRMNLYVALIRASSSLTVLSAGSTVSPAPMH
jgi:hypothetical protein